MFNVLPALASILVVLAVLIVVWFIWYDIKQRKRRTERWTQIEAQLVENQKRAERIMDQISKRSKNDGDE